MSTTSRHRSGTRGRSTGVPHSTTVRGETAVAAPLTNARTRIVGERTGFLADVLVLLVRASDSATSLRSPLLDSRALAASRAAICRRRRSSREDSSSRIRTRSSWRALGRPLVDVLLRT